MISGGRVASWVSESAAQLALNSFAQSDLDEFTEVGEIPADAARVALDLFVDAVDRVVASDLDVDLMLTLPLPWSDAMTTEHPTLAEVLRRPWTELEIPGLSMIRPDLWRSHPAVEEYRAPIRTDLRAGRPVVGYYRTWLSDPGNGSTPEWARTLFLSTDHPQVRQVTTGWHLVGVVPAGQEISVGGVDPWGHEWQRAVGRICVAHPDDPRRRHLFDVSTIEGPAGRVTFAAGELSPGVWAFHVPDR